MGWEYISYYGRDGDLASVNVEIWPSVADYWHESPLVFVIVAKI